MGPDIFHTGFFLDKEFNNLSLFLINLNKNNHEEDFYSIVYAACWPDGSKLY
jgi:hypothetical protein